MNTRELSFIKKLFIAKDTNQNVEVLLTDTNRQSISYIWYCNFATEGVYNPEHIDSILYSFLGVPQKWFFGHDNPDIPESVKMTYPDYRNYVENYPPIRESILNEYNSGLLETDNLNENEVFTPHEITFFEKLILANMLYEQSYNEKKGRHMVEKSSCLIVSAAENDTTSSQWYQYVGGTLESVLGFNVIFNMYQHVLGRTLDFNTEVARIAAKYDAICRAKYESGRRMGAYV